MMTAVAPGLKLDLACGPHKADGFVGVDMNQVPGVDTLVDLREMPWPWETNSVAELRCSHYIEHIPMLCACCPSDRVDPFVQFFNEAYRILAPGGRFTVVAPYATSHRAWQDPTHRRPISEETFNYLNQDWRRKAGVERYLGFTCDFDFTVRLLVNQQWHIANPSVDLQKAVRHYHNVVDDIEVTLTKVGQ